MPRHDPAEDDEGNVGEEPQRVTGGARHRLADEVD